MATEEGSCKIFQVKQQVILRIAPVGGKLKVIASALPSCLRLALLFLDVVVTSRVAVVFGFRTIRDDKYLHIFKQRIVGPERFPSIAIDLVESLSEQYASAFQFYMHQW